MRFKLLAALSVAGFLWTGVRAQQNGPTPVYRLGSNMEPPVLLRRVAAEYSEEALAAHVQGLVAVYAVVGEDGRTRDLRVLRPLGLGLDEKALAAVANWRFVPALKDGKPVATECTIDINFQLDPDSRPWSISSMLFSTPAGAQSARLVSAPYRQIAGLPENVQIRLSFDVGPDGAPLNIKVEESSDPRDNDEVIALIREWRFTAALLNGTAVESHGLLDLSRGLMPPAAPYPSRINGVPVDGAPAPKKKK